METTHEVKAAQPCSYIYPIYSVVKNRPRMVSPGLRLALHLLPATGAGLEYMELSSLKDLHMLKDQCPAAGILWAGGDSTSSRFAQC
jgi:hypothetical protein